MYFIEKYVCKFSMNSGGAWSLQFCRTLLLHEDKRGEYVGLPVALDVKGGECVGFDPLVLIRPLPLMSKGESDMVSMYLSVVVIKHHRGCHQVQRGRLLEI